LLQDLGITVAEVASAGDIKLTYADKENVAEATYTLTVDNSGATIAAAGTISDGSNTARTAITTIDSALDIVASERAKLGATQSQLESTVRNLANVAENTSAAAGRIMDTDYAAETANLTKAQILQQAATSILAQANAQPQAVLTLLQ
jgi:flagellin